jgi:O-methyltransferase
MGKLTFLRGKFKGFFFISQIDRIIPSSFLVFFSQMACLSAWIRKNKNCSFSDFYTFKTDYSKRYSLYQHVIENQILNSAIDYFEFGVSKGVSFKWWLENMKHEDSRFFGFDTFSGLPENWGPFKKGDMNNGNVPPVFDDNRYSFYQGLFQQTLIPFLKTFEERNRKVIHMDADIYSATLYVLTLLTPFLKKGDIIFFDEFNVPMHEFKAFSEWTKSFYINYEVLGSVNNFYQVAFLIK